jgi:hypothetical protein
MKTKEEIKLMGEKYAITHEDVSDKLSKYLVSACFQDAYTQCQEDMDKKYTEEDIRKAIEVGVNAEAGDYPKGFTHKLGISLEDYFINSLNKQD